MRLAPATIAQALPAAARAPEEVLGPERAGLVLAVYMALVVAGLVADTVLLVRLLGRPLDWRARVARCLDRALPSREAVRLGLLLMLCHLLGVVAYRGMHLGLPADEGRDASAIVLQSVTFHWAALAFLMGSLRRAGRGWGEVFGASARRWARHVATGLALYLATLPFLWFYSVLYQAGLRAVGYEPRLQHVAWAMTAPHAWWVRAYLALLALVLAPWVEELVFRGVGLPLLARHVGLPGAVVILSALFAGMHFHIPSLVPLFVMALALALAYVYTGSILVPAVMHAAFNLVNLALLMLARYA